MLACFANPTKKAIPIELFSAATLKTWLSQQPQYTQNWVAAQKFNADPMSICVIPDEKGNIKQVLCGLAETMGLWNVGHLPCFLPVGEYTLEYNAKFNDFAIAWGLGSYQFTSYKKPNRAPAKLVLPKEADKNYIEQTVQSIYLTRDLINTPADDMGPSELAKASKQLAKKHKASFKEIVGEQLKKQNYDSIFMVGRASDDAPRLVDFRWGNAKHPKITLVGKGVCFDTGGLDLKPSSAMLLMKKDMGGAAHVLGLANMIMQAKLPVRLRVLIPAVENSVSGNAFRPGDVIKSRKGLTVEVGNTDAEGRLVLSDALTEAASENPELIIDMATLTGAARVALGTELPAFFANQDKIADDLIDAARKTADPIWRLPLFALYRDALISPIADLNNAPIDSYGGAITAALFLNEFVPNHIPWVHFDLMAWNLKARPGRPQGGEAMGIRALFHYLSNKY